jgi:hypothetical protein
MTVDGRLRVASNLRHSTLNLGAKALRVGLNLQPATSGFVNQSSIDARGMSEELCEH